MLVCNYQILVWKYHYPYNITGWKGIKLKVPPPSKFYNHRHLVHILLTCELLHYMIWFLSNPLFFTLWKLSFCPSMIQYILHLLLLLQNRERFCSWICKAPILYNKSPFGSIFWDLNHFQTENLLILAIDSMCSAFMTMFLTVEPSKKWCVFIVMVHASGKKYHRGKEQKQGYVWFGIWRVQTLKIKLICPWPIQ